MSEIDLEAVNFRLRTRRLKKWAKEYDEQTKGKGK